MFLSLYCSSAPTETIVLKDGSTLTGTVTKVEKGILFLEGGPRSTVPIGDIVQIMMQDDAMPTIAKVTDTVMIQWGNKEVKVETWHPVAMQEVGLIPRRGGFYTQSNQYFGGRLVFDIEKTWSEVRLWIRLFDVNDRLVAGKRFVLFDVDPGEAVPFLLDISGIRPDRVERMVLGVEAMRTRGKTRADSGRGRNIPPLYLDPKAVATVRPTQP